jgi:D-ribose pyranose/furanose isomerase RbsD
MVKKEKNIVFVRTGEATPFANMMLVSGVIF